MSDVVKDKIYQIVNVLVVYFAILGFLFVLEVFIGKPIGREYLKFDVMLNQMVTIGILYSCIVSFLSDLIFRKMKYIIRMILCICLTSIGIELYTMYRSWIITQKLFALINNNQMFYLFFFILLFGWTVYSQLIKSNYKKYLVQYQKNMNTEE